MGTNHSIASLVQSEEMNLNWVTLINFSQSDGNCIRIQDHIFDYVDLIPVQIGFGTAYGLVFFLGLAVNCATLRCLMTFGTTNISGGSTVTQHNTIIPNGPKRGVKFGVSREFLISLTLADLLLIACTSLPITAVHIFSRRWLLGQYACKIGPLLQGLGCYVTSFSLSSVAIERYSIVATGRNKISQKWKITIVLGIWILAFAASSPLAFAYQLRRECLYGVGCFCGEFCDEIGWKSELDRTSYGIAAFTLQYVWPACVLAFCYYKVRQKVESGVKKRLQREHVSSISQQRLSRRKTRTSCMTLLLFAGFVCPWLPMCVMNLLRDFNHLPDDWYAVAFAASHLTAMTSVLWNPIVYCWANRMFRSAFTNALFCGEAPRCIGSAYNEEENEDDRTYLGATRTPRMSSRTASTFEPSTRRRSDNSHRSSFRSIRHSSQSSVMRSRLATVGSVDARSLKHRTSEAGPTTLIVPIVQINGSSIWESPQIDSVAV